MPFKKTFGDTGIVSWLKYIWIGVNPFRIGLIFKLFHITYQPLKMESSIFENNKYIWVNSGLSLPKKKWITRCGFFSEIIPPLKPLSFSVQSHLVSAISCLFVQFRNNLFKDYLNGTYFLWLKIIKYIWIFIECLLYQQIYRKISSNSVLRNIYLSLQFEFKYTIVNGSQRRFLLIVQVMKFCASNCSRLTF